MKNIAITLKKASKKFLSVTEQGGEKVSKEQLFRFFQRYVWAGKISAGKEVLELACGTGPGLAYIQKQAQSLIAADLSAEILDLARSHYGNRIDLRKLDACDTGLDSGSFDVIIFFEAIYYLENPEMFFSEAYRLLRSGGKILLATANKDLFDFNPSPFSYNYFNPPELSELLGKHGFDTVFFGGNPKNTTDWKSQILRLIKRFAAKYRLIPASMNGKRLVKRLIFGPLITMPKELDINVVNYVSPTPIPNDTINTTHQVLYCIARKV
jgi:SAM-dependent methyltransferase